MNQLKLVPFSENNMSIVLAWRNSSRIRLNMINNSVISETDHLAFLKILDCDPSKKYFVVELNDYPVASIYFVNLDSSTVTWGCYIGIEKPVPGLFIALVVMAGKFVFDYCQAKVLRSEVAEHNESPIKLNKYIKIPEKRRVVRVTKEGKDLEFIEYELDRSKFFSVSENALKIMPSSVKEALENFYLEK